MEDGRRKWREERRKERTALGGQSLRPHQRANGAAPHDHRAMTQQTHAPQERPQDEHQTPPHGCAQRCVARRSGMLSCCRRLRALWRRFRAVV